MTAIRVIPSSSGNFNFRTGLKTGEDLGTLAYDFVKYAQRSAGTVYGVNAEGAHKKGIDPAPVFQHHKLPGSC